MLSIPELDDIICQQLTRHDLAQCARVSKKWNTIVIPHIWGDLSGMDPYHNDFRKRRLFNMIQEEYYAEERYKESQDAEQSTRSRSLISLPAPSFLSKYGRWIRLLPNTDQFSRFWAPLLHLFRYCSPDVQAKYFWINFENMNYTSGDPAVAIADFTLPRVRHLCVEMKQTSPSSSVSKLMDLLDQHSIVLKTLEFVAHLPNMEIEGEPMVNEPKTCTTLRELVFRHFIYNTGTEPFLSMLFRRCGRVERVQVIDWTGSVQRLAQGMLDYMPDLKEISLGNEDGGMCTAGDAAMATLLSGSRKGWEVVSLRSNFGMMVIDALSKHSSTIKLLNIRKCDGTLSQDLGQLVSSCANLYALAPTTLYSERPRFCGEIDYKAFIDLDPDTGALKPWGCEASLKDLKVTITGIPRPDFERRNFVEEAYPGEGREIQGQVYDRLARFTNLETLWLGDNLNTWPTEYLDASLEMSLESGLGKLSGLKKLREICVMSLATRIDVEEAQWIAANWPRLRVFRLGNDEAREWFEKNTDIKTEW